MGSSGYSLVISKRRRALPISNDATAAKSKKVRIRRPSGRSTNTPPPRSDTPASFGPRLPRPQHRAPMPSCESQQTKNKNSAKDKMARGGLARGRSGLASCWIPPRDTVSRHPDSHAGGQVNVFGSKERSGGDNEPKKANIRVPTLSVPSASCFQVQIQLMSRESERDGVWHQHLHGKHRGKLSHPSINNEPGRQPGPDNHPQR